MSRAAAPDPADVVPVADAPSGLVAEHSHYEDAEGTVSDLDARMAEQGWICPVCQTSLLLGPANDDTDPPGQPYSVVEDLTVPGSEPPQVVSGVIHDHCQTHPQTAEGVARLAATEG